MDDDQGIDRDELSEDSVEEELISKTLVENPTLEIKVISTKAKDPPKKHWVDFISGNMVSENGMEIEFVAPSIIEGEIEMEIEETDVELEVKYWESSLIMYVIGQDLSMNVVKNYMTRF